MKQLKTCLTALAFVLAGAAVHVSAAEKGCPDGNLCFQLAPLAGKTEAPQLAEEGFSRTPLGMQQNPAAPAQQTLAADGSGKTPLGKQLMDQQASGTA